MCPNHLHRYRKRPQPRHLPITLMVQMDTKTLCLPSPRRSCPRVVSTGPQAPNEGKNNPQTHTKILSMQLPPRRGPGHYVKDLVNQVLLVGRALRRATTNVLLLFGSANILSKMVSIPLHSTFRCKCWTKHFSNPWATPLLGVLKSTGSVHWLFLPNPIRIGTALLQRCPCFQAMLSTANC